MNSNSEKIHFLYNQLSKQLNIELIEDPGIPLMLLVNGYDDQNISDSYLDLVFGNFESTNYSRIKIGKSYGELRDIRIIETENMNFYSENFPRNFLLKKESQVFLRQNVLTDNKNYKPLSIEIFNNALVIRLVTNNFSDDILFDNGKKLSTITDINLNILGFVIWNISDYERISLIEYAKSKHIVTKLQNYPKKMFERKRTMENKKCLIKKILELKNINIIDLLYYGLQRHLIDDKFIIDFAMVAIENPQYANDSVWIELAGLLNNEETNASKIIEQQIADKESIMVTHGQRYNKIWLYLSVASDICEDGLIE